MARDREEEGAEGSGSRSQPDAFLIVCRTFSVITGAVALFSVAVNVLSAILFFKNGYDIFGGIFRCYVALFALFVAAAETEWGLIFKFFRVLEYWAGRGMLQILYVFFSLFLRCNDPEAPEAFTVRSQAAVKGQARDGGEAAEEVAAGCRGRRGDGERNQRRRQLRRVDREEALWREGSGKEATVAKGDPAGEHLPKEALWNGPGQVGREQEGNRTGPDGP